MLPYHTEEKKGRKIMEKKREIKEMPIITRKATAEELERAFNSETSKNKQSKKSNDSKWTKATKALEAYTNGDITEEEYNTIIDSICSQKTKGIYGNMSECPPINEDETYHHEAARLARDTAVNVMKAKQSKRGDEQYNPWNPNNYHNLEDFTGDCEVALIEYITANNLQDKTLNAEQMKEVKQAMFRACNLSANALQRNMNKHLYIEQTYENSKGEIEEVQYIDVTVDISGGVEACELSQLLAEGLTAKQWKVLKLYALGYTDETIAHKMSITQQAICKIRHTAVKKARDICIESGYWNE